MNYNCTKDKVLNCLPVNKKYANGHMYQCEARNSVGVGKCEFKVTGK